MCPSCSNFSFYNYGYLLFSRMFFLIHMDVCILREKERRGYLFGLKSCVNSSLLISSSLKNLIILQLSINWKSMIYYYQNYDCIAWILSLFNNIIYKMLWIYSLQYIYLYISFTDSHPKVIIDCYGNRPV